VSPARREQKILEVKTFHVPLEGLNAPAVAKWRPGKKSEDRKLGSLALLTTEHEYQRKGRKAARKGKGKGRREEKRSRESNQGHRASAMRWSTTTTGKWDRRAGQLLLDIYHCCVITGHRLGVPPRITPWTMEIAVVPL
jgi:hypothetical protein